MNWISKETDGYEMFWHITTRENAESIKETGIKQSITGIYGDGVYCITRNPYEQTTLHNVINFMEQNDFEKKDLVIVEFEYRGEYFINAIGGIYQENEWISIPSDIPVELIDKIIELNEV